MENIYVFDDGVIRGFIEMNGTQLSKIYVDSFFQSQGVGDALIRYATEEFGADNLWALEKNKRAISFYQNHGFQVTGRKRLEENTTEYLDKIRKISLDRSRRQKCLLFLNEKINRYITVDNRCKLLYTVYK